MVQINLRKTELLGWILIAIAFVFGVVESLYFGSNWMPDSKAEFVCDMISQGVYGAGASINLFAAVLKLKKGLKDIKSARR